MAKAKVRLSEEEASRLDGLLKDEAVITAEFGEGHVTKITRGSIQVLNLKRRTIYPYSIYDAFISGNVRFKDSFYQEEMLHSLYAAAKEAGIRTPPEIEQASKESDKPHVGIVDVPGNVRLVCFFKGVDEEKYLFHMRHVGLKGFEESLAEGFRQDPFIALRETEYYLGCSSQLLVSSFEEFLCQILKECLAAMEWSWKDSKNDSLDDGRAYRFVSCENKDGWRSFAIHAVYYDRDMRRCNALQVSLAEAKRGAFEIHTMRFGVLDPAQDTVDLFNAAFRSAGESISAKPAKADASPPIPATTPSKSAERNAVRYDKAPTVVENTVASPQHKKAAKKQAKPIHVNEFLVRRSYGSHRSNGHSLEPIRATVSIIPKAGLGPYPVEFDAYWCPKCCKYFMGEGTYLGLKKKGYICCKVVEEKDLGTKKAGDGVYGKLASESILHMYGYTVNQKDNLSEAERHTIISFVIENKIQTAQDIAHLLEWLISQREGNYRMSVALSRWRADLKFVKHYHKPTRRVQVDRIYAKI